MRNQTELGELKEQEEVQRMDFSTTVYLQTESGDVTSQTPHLLITTSLTFIKQNILVKKKGMRS